MSLSGDLKDKVLKNLYNEHPQGKQLLDLDINEMVSDFEDQIEDLEDYAVKQEDEIGRLKEESAELIRKHEDEKENFESK